VPEIAAVCVLSQLLEQSGRPRDEDFKILKQLRSGSWTPTQWDEEPKYPWLIAPDCSWVIGYDDAESVAIKTR
jgi:hypothetical protein